MTNKKESKKLNRLSINKETISDLDVPQEQNVVGGAGSQSPAQCIPQTIDDRQCNSKRPQYCPGPIVAPKPSVYC
jgi:hypothetical protein